MTGDFRKLFSVTVQKTVRLKIRSQKPSPNQVNPNVHLIGQKPCPGLLPLPGRIGLHLWIWHLAQGPPMKAGIQLAVATVGTRCLILAISNIFLI